MMTYEDILSRVCTYYRLPLSLLRSRNRKSFVCVARHEAMWLLRHTIQPRLSYDRIGQLLQKDHSSVIHGVQAVEYRTQSVEGYLEHLDEIVHGAKAPAPEHEGADRRHGPCVPGGGVKRERRPSMFSPGGRQ